MMLHLRSDGKQISHAASGRDRVAQLTTALTSAVRSAHIVPPGEASGISTHAIIPRWFNAVARWAWSLSLYMCV